MHVCVPHLSLITNVAFYRKTFFMSCRSDQYDQNMIHNTSLACFVCVSDVQLNITCRLISPISKQTYVSFVGYESIRDDFQNINLRNLLTVEKSTELIITRYLASLLFINTSDGDGFLVLNIYISVPFLY